MCVSPSCQQRGCTFGMGEQRRLVCLTIGDEFATNFFQGLNFSFGLSLGADLNLPFCAPAFGKIRQGIQGSRRCAETIYQLKKTQWVQRWHYGLGATSSAFQPPTRSGVKCCSWRRRVGDLFCCFNVSLVQRICLLVISCRFYFLHRWPSAEYFRGDER